MNLLQIKRLWDHEYPFRPARSGDAGIDLYNASPDPVTIQQNRASMIATGWAVKIPDGHVGIIKARSSTFAKKGLIIIDGVIDAGYTGPLFVQAWNPGIVPGDALVEPGERLAQIVVLPHFEYCPRMRGESDDTGILEVEDLPDTERGSKGFGSTGV